MDCVQSPFLFKGLRSSSIIESPVQISINNEPNGHFQALEVFERVSGPNGYPQTIVDIVSNMYSRLTNQKPDGTSATFGTSIIGVMWFRTNDEILHLIQEITENAVFLGDSERLEIIVSGIFKELAKIPSTRSYPTEATLFQTEITIDN